MCGCDSDWYPEPGDWFWNNAPTEYKFLPFKKRRKCCSCGELIEVNALAVEHTRVRVPDTDIELRIYGEEGEIPIASDWMCEKCGDLYFSLAEIGYCISPRDSMRELVQEHVGEVAYRKENP
jgi:hypothetical protein